MTEPNFFNSTQLRLLRKDGSSVRAIDALKDVDYVLIYFSAHWCPPCREFTPVLKKFYEDNHVKKNFEIVFMSLDKSEEEMLEYFKEAHGDYYCLRYIDSKANAAKWGDKYGFKTIPTLLVFENKFPRKVVAKCGRDMVLKDPNAENFPWRDADPVQSGQTSLVRQLPKLLLAMCFFWLLFSYFTQ